MYFTYFEYLDLILGHELLPMSLVLKYLISSYKPLVPKELLLDITKTSSSLWQDFADAVKGM